MKTRKYYRNKLCCNIYISNTTQLKELNQNFINFLENIPIKTISTSHALINTLVPKIT